MEAGGLAPGFEGLTVEAVQASEHAEKIQGLEQAVDENIFKGKLKKQKDPKPPPMPRVSVREQQAFEKHVEREIEEKEKSEKHKVISKVKRYKTNAILGHYLKDIKPPGVSDSLESWEVTLNEIRTTLNTLKARDSAYNYLKQGAQLAEYVTVSYPDKFQGVNLVHPIRFTDVIESREFREKVKEEVEQITIEYPHFFEQSPIYRFIYAVAEALWQCANTNRALNQTSPEVKQEIDKLFK
jgi:hypothetical protein